MKTLSAISSAVFLILILFTSLLIVTCSKTESKRGNQLLTPEMLTSKETEYFKKKNFIEENEKIVYVYSLSKIKKEAVLLTDKKLLVYNKDSVERESFENIFDISTSHAVTADKKSTITVYRKDDTEFSAEFIGATDIDDKIFSELRRLWRIAMSKKQVGASPTDTSGGILFSVNEKQEKGAKADKKN